MPITDKFNRPLESLRISVTDRCNLRCAYCMPEQEYVWMPKEKILNYEEVSRLIGIFSGLGVKRVRLTGGEPLLRHDLPVLVRKAAEIPGIEDVTLTTNGIFLAEMASELRAAGLHRMTVSLDTIRRERFRKLTGRDELESVMTGIDAAVEAGFSILKINTVVIRGTNEDEISELLSFAHSRKAEIRFIEYMDVGGATRWSLNEVVGKDEILSRIQASHGEISPLSETAAPAGRYRLADGTIFGVIASVTLPFCRSCNRSRITADGTWYLCLYAERGLDLRSLMRGGASDDEISEAVRRHWVSRDDRGAEVRLEAMNRGPLYSIHDLRSDPHLEMHTRGG